MKHKIEEIIEIPPGLTCEFRNKNFTCKNNSNEVSRIIDVPRIEIIIRENKIILTAEKGSKKELKMIKSQTAHIKNLFLGLKNKFIYKLEACNVHFPMTLKAENGKLIINNFLGEKVRRLAEILPGVELDIKGPQITLSSHDKDAAGKTAANIERATKIKNRDRRIFQDGIFIVEKPEANVWKEKFILLFMAMKAMNLN